jgi:glycosyltransferase involved in cell wall biosynthesis
METTIIIPAYNESESILKVIQNIRKYTNAPIIVGDNNSIDNTAQIATENGCKVIKVKRQGKGATVKELIRQVETEQVIMTDGDGTYPVGACFSYFNLLLENYEVVCGYRKTYNKNAMSRINFFGNKLLSFAATCLYFRNIKDVCTGLWGFRTSVAKKFDIRATGFDLEADIFSQIALHKYKMIQVPIKYYNRAGGQSSLKVETGIEILKRLIINRRGEKKNGHR